MGTDGRIDIDRSKWQSNYYEWTWEWCDRITGIVHVDDLVQAMVLAAEKAPSCEHFIISAGELSIGEMFQILGQAAGVKAPADAPRPLVRAIGGLLDPIGKAFS